MERNKFLFTAAMLVIGTTLDAQENKLVLGSEAMMDMVRRNHPVAKQAVLLVNKTDAELQSARGAFDPAFELDASCESNTSQPDTHFVGQAGCWIDEGAIS